MNRDGVSFDFELKYEGLQAPVQQAHIHFAEKRVNGPIVIWLCGTPAIPVGAAYVNVHSAVFAGGRDSRADFSEPTLGSIERTPGAESGSGVFAGTRRDQRRLGALATVRVHLFHGNRLSRPGHKTLQVPYVFRRRDHYCGLAFRLSLLRPTPEPYMMIVI